MKRLLGLLALALVPALLTIPTSPTAHAAVGARDLEARTSKILSLAAKGKWDDVARLANPKMVAWVKARDHRVREPKCKKSVASRPGAPVYACLYREATDFHFTVDMKWWLFYRQVAGKWTLVNERIITSATAYRTRQNLLARAAKIWKLALADDWTSVAQYTTPAGLDQLKAYVEEQESAEGPFQPDSVPRPAEQVNKSALFGAYGRYFAFLPQRYDDNASHGLKFDLIGGRWLATGEVDLEY